MINSRFTPLLTSLASTEATRHVEEIITSAVYRELEDSPTLYSDVVALTYRNDGNVAALRTDTAKLIKARTNLVESVLAALTMDENLSATIPLASLLGLNVLNSYSAFTLELRVTKSLNAYFVSSFDECGINQTRHRILFILSIDIVILIPGRATTVTVTRELPFAETVIVGEVPDAYTEINRLTDDITESELDDIYDFGAAYG